MLGTTRPLVFFVTFLVVCYISRVKGDLSDRNVFPSSNNLLINKIGQMILQSRNVSPDVGPGDIVLVQLPPRFRSRVRSSLGSSRQNNRQLDSRSRQTNINFMMDRSMLKIRKFLSALSDH